MDYYDAKVMFLKAYVWEEASGEEGTPGPVQNPVPDIV